jgi:putative ABC transport system permease protein
MSDLKFVLRVLARSRGFTTTVVLALAVGIGALLYGVTPRDPLTFLLAAAAILAAAAAASWIPARRAARIPPTDSLRA